MTHDYDTTTFEAVNIGAQRALVITGEADVGDRLTIRERDQETGLYSGRWVVARVTFLQPAGPYSIASLEVVARGTDHPYFKRVSGARQAA